MKYRRCAAPLAGKHCRGGGGGTGCLTELCWTKDLWYLLHNGCYKRPLFSRFSGHFLPLCASLVFNFIVSITHNSHHFPRPGPSFLLAMQTGLRRNSRKKDLPLALWAFLNWCSRSDLSDRHGILPLGLKRFHLVRAHLPECTSAGLRTEFNLFCSLVSLSLSSAETILTNVWKPHQTWAYLLGSADTVLLCAFSHDLHI